MSSWEGLHAPVIRYICDKPTSLICSVDNAGTNNVQRQPAHPSCAAAAAAKKKNAECEAAQQRKESAALLTKAADMGKTPRNMEGPGPLEQG